MLVSTPTVVPAAVALPVMAGSQMKGATRNSQRSSGGGSAADTPASSIALASTIATAILMRNPHTGYPVDVDRRRLGLSSWASWRRIDAASIGTYSFDPVGPRPAGNRLEESR